MWRNVEVLELVDWLRAHNQNQLPNARRGFTV
jgi:erythromycin esterase-like protein